MKIAVVNRSCRTGGAAVVSARLADALAQKGHDVSFITLDNPGEKNPYPKLERSPHSKWDKKPYNKFRKILPFLTERLKIFIANGFNRETLFKIDTASDGLPLWRHPAVAEADAVLLNWTNQGMLSLKGLGKILDLDKPTVVTMHDMWAFTGICHHAGSCRRFEKQCGNCPLLTPGDKLSHNQDDLSHKIWLKKRSVYGQNRKNLAFVAVSNWLADKAHRSSLLKDQTVVVIPNAFPYEEPRQEQEASLESELFTVLFGAARIDDPIKDHLGLTATMEELKRRHPELAARTRIITYGNLKDPEALKGMPVAHTHLGPVAPSRIEVLYRQADAVLSTSLYETLPGTLVEGQAWGAIPVATAHGGQPDIIDHLQTGYLAEWSDDRRERARRLADGLAWAARQDKTLLAPRMRQAVKTKFFPQTVAAAYETLLTSLCP